MLDLGLNWAQYQAEKEFLSKISTKPEDPTYIHMIMAHFVMLKGHLTCGAPRRFF